MVFCFVLIDFVDNLIYHTPVARSFEVFEVAFLDLKFFKPCLHLAILKEKVTLKMLNGSA